ncbi:MAG: phosphatase PAP2 family protein [Gammaproteobacteria bacterium]|nr:phosphatase PAP2 family protein [Gammaproteobacteria bacterium]
MIYFFFMMVVVTIATIAIQYTPFPTIDKQIVAFEAFGHIHLETLINWTHNHPTLNHYLWLTYNSLPYQMCYFPLFVIFMKRSNILHEYFFLMLFCTLIGFTFYYFFPTAAPASVINSPYFIDEQRATELKFFQIHHYIPTTTNDGGMIALPSFHVIWAWLCLYITRFSPLLFILVLPITSLLLASCVLLGWHYLTDVLGAIVVLLLAHGTYFYMMRE